MWNLDPSPRGRCHTWLLTCGAQGLLVPVQSSCVILVLPCPGAAGWEGDGAADVRGNGMGIAGNSWE